MDKFGFVELKDVCNINMGQSPDSDSYNDNEDGIPFFQGNADFGEKYPTTRKWCNAPTKIAHAEDILISVRAPIGALNYAKEECCIGRGLAAITPNQDKVSSEFIYWLLKGKHKELNLQGTGSTFKAISRKVLEEIKVPDIELKKQTELAGNLEKVYSVIQLRKQQLKELDTLIKARFVEMFGDPIHNDKGWDTDSVSAVCADIYGGGTPSKAHPEYYENGDIPWVSSKDMKTDVITESQIYINQLGVDNSSAKMVPINSVIMVIRSGILKHTLPVAINAVPITVNQDLKVFIPNNRILTRFLAIQFKMHEADILTGVRAVTADNIEFETLKTRSIIVPPIELQQEYIDFVIQIDKLKLK